MPSNPASPQDRSSHWSLTCWFTEKSGWTRRKLDEFVANEMDSTWSIEGQIEEGEDSQGLHAQLHLHTPWIRASKIMKAMPKVHVEVARKLIALKQYVHKDETRVDEFKTVETKSPQWHIVISRFAQWVLETHPQLPDEPPEERKLFIWDEFIRESIREGMRLDIVGVNPQYRSCVIRYWTAYMWVAENRPPLDKQTDRQTDNLESSSPPPQIIFSDNSIPICPPVSPAPPAVLLPVALRRCVRRVLLAEQATSPSMPLAQ